MTNLSFWQFTLGVFLGTLPLLALVIWTGIELRRCRR